MIFNNIHIRLFIAFIGMLLTVNLNAQTIPVQDSAFAKYLYDTYPALCPVEGQLDTAAAKSLTGVMKMDDKEIKSLNEIIYFKSINGILASGNEITEFPKLEGFINLEYIYLVDNQLSVAPDISAIPSIEAIDFRNNQVKEIPAFGDLPKLSRIIAKNNWISQLPDLVHLPSLDSVNFIDNYLNWEELEIFSTYPGFDTIFHVFRQHDLTPSTTNVVYKGENLRFEYPGTLDTAILTFRWHSHNIWDSVIVSATNKYYVVENISDDVNYYEVSSRHKYINEWGDKYLISGENKVISYNCPQADSMEYNITFDCEIGYKITFNSLKIEYDTLLPNYIYTYNLIDSNNNVVNTVEPSNSYFITPGKYRVWFTNGKSCSSFFPDIIEVGGYPDIVDVKYNAYENCKESLIEVTDVKYNVPLLSPAYSIKNSNSGNIKYINLDTEYPIEHGNNIFIVDGGKYCYDSIDIYDAPFIPECNCVQQVNVNIKDNVNCKNGTITYSEVSTPDSYTYNIIAENKYNHKVDTLEQDVAKLLSFGSYSISAIDDFGCAKVINDNFYLKKSTGCDVILYYNVEGASSSQYVTGDGNVKLINEKGVVIYTKTLPTEISVYDNDNSVLPSGLYMLVFDDGSSQAVTIVW